MTVSSFDMTFTARDGVAYDGRMSTPAGDGTAPAILIIPAIFGTDAEMEGLIEDFAHDGLEGLGREVRRGALELHALVGGPDDR